MGYGTRLHDWELDELGSVKSSVSVSVSLCVVSGSCLIQRRRANVFGDSG
jgi:hypothetical protein